MFVTIYHCICVKTNETRRMIGEKEIAQMKNTAYIINTARVGLLSRCALLRSEIS
jgi:phosphoglycerate dehydrogenase-like enzyme